jgi:hypothetical protein
VRAFKKITKIKWPLAIIIGSAGQDEGPVKEAEVGRV